MYSKEPTASASTLPPRFVEAIQSHLSGQFPKRIVERYYQGHGVWDTSYSLRSEDKLWERVRSAFYSIIRLKRLSSKMTLEAEDFLLSHPTLLESIETVIPRIFSFLEEKGWSGDLTIDMLKDPDAPRVPVFYVRIVARGEELSSKNLMQMWDHFSSVLDSEMRSVAEIRGMDSDRINQLRSQTSLIMARDSE